MFTKDEAELYDRQIRLWGVNAQAKLRQSRVLMIGFNGVASEVAKILVLAGIESLTIIDNEPLQESDLSTNLFCRKSATESQFRTHEVREKLKVLNPLVQVEIINEPIRVFKIREAIIQSKYDLVSLHTFLTIDEIVSLNNECRKQSVKFYIAVDFGFYAFMFNDLGDEFRFTYEDYSNSIDQTDGKEKADPINISDDDNEDRNNDDDNYGDDDDYNDDADDKPRKRRRLKSPSRNDQSNLMQQKRESLRYCSFESMISLENYSANRQSSPVMIMAIAMFKYHDKFNHHPKSESDMEDFEKILDQLKKTTGAEDNFKRLDPTWIENISSGLSPVCAVIGGITGQDIIRALSLSGIPIYNTFSFDGLQMSGKIEKVGLDYSKTATRIKPVVRDYVEIDVDDDVDYENN